MARKGRRQDQKRLVVNMHQVATPDSNTMLSRTIGILFKAAARKNAPQPKRKPNTQKGKPPAQAPTEDALTRGGGGNDSHNEG